MNIVCCYFSISLFGVSYQFMYRRRRYTYDEARSICCVRVFVPCSSRPASLRVLRVLLVLVQFEYHRIHMATIKKTGTSSSKRGGIAALRNQFSDCYWPLVSIFGYRKTFPSLYIFVGLVPAWMHQKKKIKQFFLCPRALSASVSRKSICSSRQRCTSFTCTYALWSHYFTCFNLLLIMLLLLRLIGSFLVKTDVFLNMPANVRANISRKIVHQSR